MRGARDNQRRTRLINQDVVHLVYNREVQKPLALLEMLGKAIVASRGHPHVVTEVVEAEFIIGAVCDIAGIGQLTLGGVHTGLDRADGEPHADVQRPHPFHVAAGEIVVDCDHVYALALEGIEVGWQRGHERFALACDHLGNRTGVQHHSADQLHIVMPHDEKSSARFPANGKGLNQDVVERFTSCQAAAEFTGLSPQFGIRERLIFRLEGINGLYFWFEPTYVSGVRGAEHAR